VQLVFHKGHVCTCGQIEVQLSQQHGRLQKIPQPQLAALQVLAISNKLIFCTTNGSLVIQHLLEIVPGERIDNVETTTMVPGDREP